VKILIDADIVAYRCAAACENEKVSMAIMNTNRSLAEIIMSVDHDDRFYDDWDLYLTGKTNFRFDVAVTAIYKGNRANKTKPRHLKDVREHMVKEWGAVIYEGYEADDAITTEGQTLNGDCIIVSIDKDFKQFSGWHYNPVKREKFFVTPYEGMRFFYMQILMGDSADNIIGLDRVGPKTAEKMLKSCETEIDMYNVCMEAYQSEDRILENARLLWLRRTPNEMWTSPND
jgi:5'-3' exonuclease